MNRCGREAPANRWSRAAGFGDRWKRMINLIERKEGIVVAALIVSTGATGHGRLLMLNLIKKCEKSGGVITFINIEQSAS